MVIKTTMFVAIKHRHTTLNATIDTYLISIVVANHLYTLNLTTFCRNLMQRDSI